MHCTITDKSETQRASWATFIEEPFRIFFPLGAVCSFLGIFFWVLREFDWAFQEVSTKVHVWIQIYGFMMSFITGFLCTAIPRFTRTAHISGHEVLLLFGLISVSVVSVLREAYHVAHGCFLAAIVSLAVILGVRGVRKKRRMPETFIFIPFALLCAVSGSLAVNLVIWGSRWKTAELYTLGSNLLFQGFIMFLLLGIGGFLIRSILGWAPALPSSADEQPKVPARSSRGWFHILCAVGILLSFPLEVFFNNELGLGLRASLVTLEAVVQMKVHRRPVGGKLTAYWLLAAVWLMIIGLWGAALCPIQYRLSFMHLCFGGGFTLSVFSIATRVIFNHGGYGHLLHGNYLPFTITVVLLSVGLGTRVVAPFIPEMYTRHLAYAGLTWCLGLLVWCSTILPKVLMCKAKSSQVSPD